VWSARAGLPSVRLGNWLTPRQTQALLNAPDATTQKGLRDRAILAILLGCGLQRSEVAAPTFKHIPQRDGRSPRGSGWQAQRVQTAESLTRETRRTAGFVLS
jgi:site-specific recombinase XerD